MDRHADSDTEVRPLYELAVLPDRPAPRRTVADAPAGFPLRYDPAHAADTLTDGFGRRHTVLRISLTERCNLRCTYCMPEDGVDLTPAPHLLRRDEIARLARLFVAEGVTKIRLTGGEPLLRPDAVAVAEDLGGIDGLETLALTTNGLLLPKRLPALKAAGLTHLTVSLDTLRPDRFERLTRRRGFEIVLGAVERALAEGYAVGTARPLKLNCVVLRGVNDDELADFVALTEAWPVEVRFIEFMPFTGNGWEDGRLVPFAEMLDRLRARYPLEPLNDGPHATARTYRVPGFRGRVGFIASMTAPFCAGCNRLRLTADGALNVCLFGRAEVSLRDALRAGASDAEVAGLIGRAVGAKRAQHAGLPVPELAGGRPMTTIGG